MILLHVLCRYISGRKQISRYACVYIAYQHSEQQHYSCGRDAHENASSSKLWKSRVCDACCVRMTHSSFRTFQHSPTGMRKASKCTPATLSPNIMLEEIFMIARCSSTARRNEINIIEIFIAHFHCVAQISENYLNYFTDFGTLANSLDTLANISLRNYY